MERKRKHEHVHRGIILCGKIYRGCVGGGRQVHSHLSGVQQNPVLLGPFDDAVAKFVFRTAFSKHTTRLGGTTHGLWCLGCDVFDQALSAISVWALLRAIAGL